ncbi:MAG: hypothetical protein GY719_05105 [bacterium]|nr:hypothetical protein [bacterium]
MSETVDRERGFLASLGTGFLAGCLGGWLFLAVALLRDGADFLVYWPTRAFAVWLIVRSVGLYALLFGAAGLTLGGVLYTGFALLGRDRRPIFVLVSATMVALTVLTYLTAWWQLDVLSGLPMAAVERRWSGLLHAGVALLAGGAGAVLGLRLARRRTAARPSWRPALAALAAGVALVTLGELGLRVSSPRGDARARPGQPARVVVVGLDGMTLRVLSPMLRAGELPTFRRLTGEGAWGTYLTYGTASSPRVWTSMATGKRVRDHGIDDFVKARGRGYRAAPMRSSDRKARAIWNILGDSGHRVGVVNWLITYPPEEVDGYIVSRLNLRAENRTHPPELEAELAELWGERPEGTREHLLWEADRVFATAAYLLAKDRLTKDRLDFLALFDATVDRVEHRYWRDYRPGDFDSEVWPADTATGPGPGTLVEDVYRHLDRRLGELLQIVGDDALVIVVSDHGQRAARTPRVRLRLDRVLEALDYCRLEDGPGDRVDHAASRAYTLVETPWTPELRVNLNLRGREPHGIVERGGALELADRLVTDLRKVRFTDGSKLFGRVRRLRDPARESRGDADVQVALSRRARTAAGDGPEVVAAGRVYRLSRFQRVDASISGDHDHQGVFFAHGPGIEPGPIGQRVVPSAAHDLLWHLTDKLDAVDLLLPALRRLGWIERASTLDLTPTVLYALGLPVARDMAGRPLVEIFSRPPDVEWLASYETGDEPRRADEEAPSDDEYLERLRSLGYVD